MAQELRRDRLFRQRWPSLVFCTFLVLGPEGDSETVKGKIGAPDHRASRKARREPARRLVRSACREDRPERQVPQLAEHETRSFLRHRVQQEQGPGRRTECRQFGRSACLRSARPGRCRPANRRKTVLQCSAGREQDVPGPFGGSKDSRIPPTPSPSKSAGAGESPAWPNWKLRTTEEGKTERRRTRTRSTALKTARSSLPSPS